jgi:hypothetical protein
MILGLSLIFGKDKPLKLITSPQVYSMKYTELNEEFKIPLMMNKNQTYHLDQNYIVKSSIKSGEEELPISIKNIQVSNETTEINNEQYYMVFLIVNLLIESNDHIIQFDQANLYLKYENEFELDLYIGEFNYVFEESIQELSLLQLKGSFDEIEGNNTVTGIMLELKNSSGRNITIKRLDLFSKSIGLNNDYLIEKNELINYQDSVESILLIDSYDYESYEISETEYFLLNNQSKLLYVPLTYHGNIKFISRFVIRVTYLIDGQEKELYIDDFIFMNQSLFEEGFEGNYHFYEYDHS